METLPLELVDTIGQYLTTQELAACCATCIKWRDAFNYDFLWKPRCRQSTAEYLKTTECKVKPVFVSPELENSSLSPICEWRMCFMRENHLLNNWRQGKCVTNTNRSSQIVSEPRAHIYNVMIGNDHLLKFFNTRATLWDIRNQPVYLCDPFYVQQVMGVRYFKTFGNNNVIVVQKNRVDTFKISSPINEPWLHCHSFLYDSPITEPIDKTVGRKPTRYLSSFHIDNIYVGICYNMKVSMHIWNLDSGVKLKTVDFPDSIGSSVGEIVSPENSSMDFLIAIRNYSQKTMEYYIFNLKKLDFSNFRIKTNVDDSVVRYICAINDDFVAIRAMEELRIYNYHTSELMRTVMVDNDVVSVDNHFAFIQNNRVNLICATKTGLENESLLVGSKNTGDIQHVILNKFLVTSKCGTLGAPEVWSVINKLKTKEVRLLEWFIPCCVELTNEACSKVLLQGLPIAYMGEDYIQVFNLW